ncbi:hypothetical protein Scep_002719 [Stephania cephalantha]|uniref:Uncharacterized protein n=1 Tax=Stephania cephalantha TaxID=152367 RepID=A0AAP0Q585_9MAGN
MGAPSGGPTMGGGGGDAAAAFLQRWPRLVAVLFGGGDATPSPLYFAPAGYSQSPALLQGIVGQSLTTATLQGGLIHTQTSGILQGSINQSQTSIMLQEPFGQGLDTSPRVDGMSFLDSL